MSKYDDIMKAYVELAEVLAHTDDVTITKMLESWSMSFSQIEEYLAIKQVTKSQVVAGLSQGLRDLPGIISDLPSGLREGLFEEVRSVVHKHMPGFYR